jgi:hypothetical protein
MLRNSLNVVKRFFIAMVLAMSLSSVAVMQRASASDFRCTNIDVDGVWTGNIFCTSSTSSAGFYYFYYNVYTGEYTIGP